MGKMEFFRKCQQNMPAALQAYFRGTNLLLSGERLHDCHFPDDLRSVWSNVTTLTLLGPGIDHNTMFYNLHKSVFPKVTTVRVCKLPWFEWRAYGLRKQAVWEFPIEFDKNDWEKGDYRSALENGAAPFLRHDAFSMDEVERGDEYSARNEFYAWVQRRLQTKETWPMAHSADGLHASLHDSSDIKIVPSVFLNKELGWVAKDYYEFWLMELFADPKLAMNGYCASARQRLQPQQ